MEVFDINKTEFENTTTLIEASAGTGKTYTITSLVVRLLLLKKLTIDQILVVTFTEAAASELKDRILKRLREVLKGFALKEADRHDEIEDPFVKNIVSDFDTKDSKEKITRAIRSFDLAPVFTIHGFCYRILSENAFETKNFFNSEIITDENILIQQSADDFYRKYISKVSIEEAKIIHSNNLYPEEIADLAKKYLKYDNLEITAEKPVQDISSLFKEFSKKEEELSRLWFLEKGSLEELFYNDDSLNKQKYKPAYFEKRSSHLDYLFENLNNSPEIYVNEKLGSQNNPFLYFIKSAIDKGTKKGKNPPENIFFEKAEVFYNYCLEIDSEIKNFISWFKKTAIKETKEQLDKIKEQYRLFGFNDFLTGVKKGIDKDSTGILLDILKNKYRAALIDEFQDTDSLQYEIFKKVFKNKVPLFFIGDPKQAIYRFRGADLFAYLNAKDDADYIYTMDKNYRSSPGVVNSVNRIFSQSDNPFIYEKVGFQNIVPAKDDNESVFENNEKSSSMNIVYLTGNAGKNYGESEKFLNKYICSEISRLLSMGEQNTCFLKDKPVSLEDIAVLVRSNDQGRSVRKALEESNIPAVLTSEESIFDSEEALSVLEFLDCVHNNSNEKKIRGVLTGNLFLKTSSELNVLVGDENNWNQVVEDFKEFNFIWTEKGVMEMLNHLYFEHNILSIQAGLNSGERRITNLLHLFEILHEEETKNRHGQESLIKWLGENIFNRTSSAQEYELRLESDKNKVKILTVHKSKGLEFPVVFCGFIQREAGAYLSSAKEALYHEETDYNLVLDLNPKKDDKCFSLMEKEMLSEDLRLFYVALTRAKFKTYFFMNDSCKKNFERSPDCLFKKHEDLQNFLSDIQNNSDGDIKAEIYDTDTSLGIYDFSHKHEKTDYKRCEFTREAKSNFKILSFSYLAHSKPKDNEKFDSETSKNMEIYLKEPLSLGIHGFPKGAFAGIFFHSIFEDLDFGADDETISELVKSKLESFSYDLKWFEIVFDMVKNVLNKDLSKGFKLSDIKEEKKLTELEFYYPVRKNQINDFFKTLINSDINPEFRESLKLLNAEDIKGFMKGFIDLVFEYENKFYILDWKSNHLGFSYSDYDQITLNNEMAHTSYFLQYYIYCAALDKYLEYRLGNNYSFEENFGGVFYIFLRGVDNEENLNGVYYDMPLKLWN